MKIPSPEQGRLTADYKANPSAIVQPQPESLARNGAVLATVPSGL